MMFNWFAAFEQIAGVPGLELPGLDVAAVARGYGMRARDVTDREELSAAMREAVAADDGPRLVQARVASGMWVE
jgi:benzoylformate decarboxylase